MKQKKNMFFILVMGIMAIFFMIRGVNQNSVNKKIYAEESSNQVKVASTTWISMRDSPPTIIEENNKTQLSFRKGSLKTNMVTNSGMVYNAGDFNYYLGIYGLGLLSEYRPQIPKGNNWAVSVGTEGDVYEVVKNITYYLRSDNQAIKAVAKDPKFPFQYEIILELDPIEGFYKTVKVTNLSPTKHTIAVAEMSNLINTGSGRPGAYSLGKNQGFFLQSSDKKTSLMYRFRDLEGKPYGDFENYIIDNYVNAWILSGFSPKSSPYGIGHENLFDEGMKFDFNNFGSVNFKTQPKSIGLNESVEGKMFMYFGEPNPPEIMIDKQEYNIYKKDWEIEITGTIFDKDSISSIFYTQYPDKTIKKESSIALERGVEKKMKYPIDVSKLEVGTNKLKIWAEDPMRINSEEVEVIVNVFEVNGIPIMKKISKGSEFSFTPKDLVSDMQSLNPAVSELTKTADTSKIGFDQAIVSLTDSIRTDQTKDISVPINIYGPNTLFDDAKNLALDAQDIWLSQVKVQGTTNLKQLIYDQIKPKAWNMMIGTSYNIEVGAHTVKVAMGSYQAEIIAKNEKNQTVKKIVNIHVVGGTPILKSDVQNHVITFLYGEEYKIEGTVLDQDSPEFTVSYKLDHDEPVEIVTNFDNTETYNQAVPFYGIIPKEKLGIGIHRVKVTVVDSEGNQASIEFDLNIKGQLSFKQPPPGNFSFPNAKISGNSKLIKTMNPIEMVVEDYRGIGTEWKIIGTLISEMQDRQSKDILKNSLVFIDESGVEEPFIFGEGLLLAQGKTSKANHEFPVKWKEEQGVLIRIPLGAKIGRYSGTMDISLVDAP